jgi:hypothetical protein
MLANYLVTQLLLQDKKKDHHNLKRNIKPYSSLTVKLTQIWAAGWRRSHPVIDGLVPELVLSEQEEMQLRSLRENKCE